MAPSGAKIRPVFLLILFYIAYRGVGAQNETSLPAPTITADPSTTIQMAIPSPSSTVFAMLMPLTTTPSLPTPSITTPLPSFSSTPTTPPPPDLSTNQIIGLAIGLSATVLLVSILAFILVFFSIRSYMHKSSLVTPLKSPKEDGGKSEVIQVTSVKHGEAVAMDSLPKSA